MLAGVLTCWVLGGIWLESGRAALARQRAETAADLAALAGAQALDGIDRSPCAAAARAAAANSARVESCTAGDDTVTVVVTVSRPRAARAQARAGPGTVG